MTTSDFQALKIFSARVGADPLLVQAAGGNTSIKTDGVMWIKASGTWLKDALTKDIFVPLDMESLSKALMEDSPDCESCLPFVRQDLNALGLRPSIETSVHGLMPQKMVAHVHCVNTIAWAIREDAEEKLRHLLGTFNWSFIPYARPGLQLSRSIRKHLKPGSDVMVLENHGLAVAADSVEAADALMKNVVSALVCPVRHFPKPDFAGLTAISEGTAYAPAADEEAHAPAMELVALQLGCRHVYYPDHVVFLGTAIPTDLTSGAVAVAVPGKGVLVRKDAKPSVEPMLRCLGDVFKRVGGNANLKALTPDEVDQLLNWDAEKYRQTLKQPRGPCSKTR